MYSNYLFITLLTLHFLLPCTYGCVRASNGERDLPNFVRPGGGGGGEPRFRVNPIQAIITSYQFDCCGVITEWGAIVEKSGGNHQAGAYSISFQVWRENAPSSYNIVGVNQFMNIMFSGNPKGQITVSPSMSERIEVQPGDVIGFYLTSSDKVDDGIQFARASDNNNNAYDDETVWYVTGNSINTSTSQYSVGTSGTLSNSTNLAPLITASVTSFDCPTTSTPTTQPTTDPPTTSAPTIATDPPTTSAPTTDPPTTSAPATDPPTTSAPTTDPPTTSAPTTDPPTTNAPMTDPPTTSSPATTTSAPVTDPPTTSVPATEQPTTASLIDSTTLTPLQTTSIQPTTEEGTTLEDTTMSSTSDTTTDSPPPTTGGVGGSLGQSSGGATVGAAIGGVIAVLLVVLIIVIIVLYVTWSRKRNSYGLNKDSGLNQLQNPTYGDGKQVPLNTGAHSGMPVLNNPNYDYAAGVQNPDDQADYDDILDSSVKVNQGANMGVYETPMDNNDYCPTPVPQFASAYEAPVATLEKGMSGIPGGGHYEWGLVVPSQEQRTKVLSLKSQTSSKAEEPEDDGIYAAIGNSQYGSGGPAPKFFEECETYWAPSSNANELYEQLAVKKYREIPRPQIQLTEFLGSGAFGTVNKGLWQSPAGAMSVAIKTMQKTDEEEKVKFLQEAAIMGQFRHPNVVKLMGVVTVGEPVMIVLELLSNGDLRDFIIKQRPAPGEMVPSDTPKLLLKFCQQVCSGMEYLARKAFVHRDLAARNILVADDKTCKISDFGMSRDLMDENYYVSHGGKVPVKWTAPEALHYKKYSSASDVWSFGCVMYEIWSLGHKPFEGYTNSQTIRNVDKGLRLPPPPGCPRELYKFMIECWHPEYSRRPSFAQLVEMLSQADFELLLWRDEDTRIHPQVLVVGAPLEAGENLYRDLQQMYC